METVKQQSIRAIELTLQKQIISRESLEEIKNIIFRYPGECPVLFRVGTGQGKEVIIAAHDRYRVFPSRKMIEEIEPIIGQKVICK
ncbi:MAG: hypothetical protein JRJ65_02545 [Deltaproteobacteria bacterium]|nr:hypothetical protein [Deltaproteobacteria bacterium]